MNYFHIGNSTPHEVTNNSEHYSLYTDINTRWSSLSVIYRLIFSILNSTWLHFSFDCITILWFMIKSTWHFWSTFWRQCRLCPLTHASPNQGESPGDHHYSKTGEGRRYLIILITKQQGWLNCVYMKSKRKKSFYLIQQFKNSCTTVFLSTHEQLSPPSCFPSTSPQKMAWNLHFHTMRANILDIILAFPWYQWENLSAETERASRNQR